MHSSKAVENLPFMKSVLTLPLGKIIPSFERSQQFLTINGCNYSLFSLTDSFVNWHLMNFDLL